MKKIVRLTENDLAKIVRRVINERQYLMEQSLGVYQTMTVKVPITKGKDNVERFAANSNVEVSLTNETELNKIKSKVYLMSAAKMLLTFFFFYLLTIRPSHF
jgi:hypothetical protein